VAAPVGIPGVFATSPQEVVLIAGRHGQVIETEKELVRELKARGIPVTIDHVDDWDVVAWSNAITASLDRLRDERVTVNLTAGHGLAVAMLAIHAAERGLPVACYDWEPLATGKAPKDWSKLVHPHSPAAVLHLKSTQPVDRQILALLLKGPQGVTALGTALDLPQSTVSTSLARLSERGFLDRDQQGRSRIYRLRDGLRPMIDHALGGST
jgi:DNA-binding transcriptional ArsR family regulator